jgi:2-methylcitrate dehydratase PrpD
MTQAAVERAAASTIAAWALELRREDVPPEALGAARDHLLDTLGCGLAALGVREATAGRALAAEAGVAGPASAIGVEHGVAPAAAALANGMLCHGLDFDDTHEASICHIGTVVGPAALAVAEAVGASGAELETAIVAGTEVVARIGMAAPEGFHRRGFHPTSVCGVFGATVAAARLRGLDAQTTTRALGLAGSMASGIFEYLADGSPTKPLHAGWAAHSGVQAAALAAAGARGPASVLEGRYGLYATHVDVPVDLDSQLADLGERWESLRVAVKLYPACHFSHAAIDAAAEAAEGLAPGEIERIVVRVSEVAVPVVLEPQEAKRAPATPYDAKFSLQWCVASRLVHGRLDVRSFEEPRLADAAVMDLVGRIDHAAWEGPPPTPFAGAAEVAAHGGEPRAVRRGAPRGTPELPVSDADLREKFLANATLCLDAATACELADAAAALEDATDARAIAGLLRAARPPAR